MELARFWRHVAMTPWTAAKAFPEAALDTIGRAVAEGEKSHRGEVRFVVEAELSTAQLWANLGSRERARQVFAAMGVWDTEENNGVLVYVLLADHRVEIVADRGIGARVEAAQWEAVCRTMQAAFREGRYEAGAVAGVQAVSALIAAHYPARAGDRNELPDRPAMI